MTMVDLGQQVAASRAERCRKGTVVEAAASEHQPRLALWGSYGDHVSALSRGLPYNYVGERPSIYPLDISLLVHVNNIWNSILNYS